MLIGIEYIFLILAGIVLLAHAAFSMCFPQDSPGLTAVFLLEGLEDDIEPAPAAFRFRVVLGYKRLMVVSMDNHVNMGGAT